MMLSNDEWLNQIVLCPKCGNEVIDGDRIWLNGECLCPACYKVKRAQLDNELKKH